MLIGPRYKICKRLGNGVFEKCQTQKFALSEARQSRTSKTRRGGSDYAKELLEMERVRYTYGLPERQLYRYVKEARRGVTSNPTVPLFHSLERRLDNVIYRLGFTSSRQAARQLVSHGHITVNGRRVTVPSRTMSIGETIGIREESKRLPMSEGIMKRVADTEAPAWLHLDKGTMEAKVLAFPEGVSESAINLPAVIEFYSR
jgi:small subunit ribosomal protein S4